MGSSMIRYKVRPDRAAENETLVKAVYEQLNRERPAMSVTNALKAAVSFRIRPAWSVSKTTCMKLTPSGSLNVA